MLPATLRPCTSSNWSISQTGEGLAWLNPPAPGLSLLQRSVFTQLLSCPHHILSMSNTSCKLSVCPEGLSPWRSHTLHPCYQALQASVALLGLTVPSLLQPGWCTMYRCSQNPFTRMSSGLFLVFCHADHGNPSDAAL